MSQSESPIFHRDSDDSVANWEQETTQSPEKMETLLTHLPSNIYFFKIMRIIKFLLLFFFSFQSIAQLEITFPVSRVVFQRNNQNVSTFSVSGYTQNPLDKVEARLVPVVAGQGTETAWTLIADNLSTSSFNGTISGLGGWYKLEVRGVYRDKIINTANLDRVGIGEVFILSGQSNAQGDQRYEGAAEGALEDRVSSIDYYEAILNEDKLPFAFSQMGNDKKIAPYHYVPYFWGKLGDLLVQKYNVPVAFYGTALGGIGSDTWKRSAAGVDLRAELPNFIAVPGMPYRSMKAALNLYAARTGVRAILWLQGESDINNAQQYFDNLKFVIEKSRQDYGKSDLAWMIARNTVPASQNLLIKLIPATFAGPNTDAIDGPEVRDVGHFARFGLRVVAGEYMNFLTQDFFNKTNPQLPNLIQNSTNSCNAANGILQLQAPAGFQNYKWNESKDGQTLNVQNSEGVFNAKMYNSSGNIFFTAPLYVPFNYYFLNGTTSISVNGKTAVCGGETVNLSVATSSNFKFTWSNGSKFESVDIGNQGSFSAEGISLAGCKVATNAQTITINPNPTQPTITIIGKAKLCEGNTTSLSVNNSEESIFLWNNGLKDKTITVGTAGNYSVQTVNSFGCKSMLSSIVGIEILPKPATPTITVLPSGPVCEGTEVTLQQNTTLDLQWSNNATTSSIKVTQPGPYRVNTIDKDGCVSNLSSPVSIDYRANPAKPVIEQISSFDLGQKNNNSTLQSEWFSENKLIANTYTLKTSLNGNYVLKNTIQYSPTLSCSSALSDVFVFANLSFFEKRLSLFPNPTVSGLCTIDVGETRTNVVLEIIRGNGDFLGRIIVGDLKDKLAIDLNPYGRGFYIIKVFSNEGSQIKRVVYE